MPARVAVVVGCNYTFDPSRVPARMHRPSHLRFAEADAQALADLLRGYGFEVALLAGADATRRAVINAIREQSRRAAGADDLLLVYFAGHGALDRDDSSAGYLVTADADPADLPGTALALAELPVQQRPAAGALTLLDCCYSDAILGLQADHHPEALGEGAPPPEEFGRRAQAAYSGATAARIVFAACAANELARELPSLRHGVFTYYLVEHWRHYPGEVDDGTLFAALDQALAKAGLPPPVRGGVSRRLVLREALAAPPGPGTTPRPSRPFFLVPYGRNPLFTGRSEELERLTELLANGRTVALAGAGGMGKTQLAIEFAHRRRDDYPGGVWWLSMQFAATTREAVASLAGADGLNLPGHEALSADDRIAFVRRRWADDEPKLLVFDNLEEPGLLEEWRPRSGGASVLLTTRRAFWPAHLGVQTLHLGPLKRPASLELLLTPRARRQGTTPAALLDDLQAMAAADAICQELGDLPLALALAAAYLEAHDQITLDRLLERIRERSLIDSSLNAELAGKLPTGHEGSILKSFDLSYDRLDPSDARDALALAMLHRAAQCAPAPIPRRLLLRAASLNPNDPDVEEQSAPALRRLASVGLLDTLPDGGLSLPPLIGPYARMRSPDQAGDIAAVEQALIVEVNAILDAGFPLVAAPYFEHLRVLAQSASGRADEIAASLLDCYGRLLAEFGRPSAARPVLEQALAIREQTLGPSHPDTARSLNNLAQMLQEQGEYATARPLYERAIAIREQALGPNHPDTASSLNNLALLLRAQGEYDAARRLYERALAIREQALGPNHPDTASSLNNLAVLLRAQGEYDAARPLFQRALAIQEQALGPSHPSVASILNNLAVLLRARGDYAAARPLFKRALAIREQALGPNDPLTAVSLANLAVLFRAEGDFDGARPLLERALAIQERVLGPSHPDTARSLSDLADLEYAQGDYAAAGRRHHQALSLRQEVLGAYHPDTASSMAKLAAVRHAEGDLAQARLLYERALEIQRRALAPFSPGMAETMAGLGKVLRDQGELSWAADRLQQALAIFERALGPEHPSTADVRRALAGLGQSTPQWVGTQGHNFSPGRDGELPIAMVNHLMMGTMEQISAQFAAPGSDTSSHYGIGVDGRVVQFVRDEDTAWAHGKLREPNVQDVPWLWDVQRRQRDPNLFTLSLQWEGTHSGGAPGVSAFAGEDVDSELRRGSIPPEGLWRPTEAQYQAGLNLIATLCSRWRIAVDRSHICLHSDFDAAGKWYSPGDGFPLQRLLAELTSLVVPEPDVLEYGVALTLPPGPISVGQGVEVVLTLAAPGVDFQGDLRLKVPRDEALNGELNVVLDAPGFMIQGNKAGSLLLHPEGPGVRSASFSLIALLAGSAAVAADLYRGARFEHRLESKIEVEETGRSAARHDATAQPRPVPRPDVVLRIQTDWQPGRSACTLRYLLQSYRHASIPAYGREYSSRQLPAGWAQQLPILLQSALDMAHSAQAEDAIAWLAAFGQYMRRLLWPDELVEDVADLARFGNLRQTLLIVADQDACAPWELLNDGRAFLGDTFIVGRWLREVEDSRPYEFPVGAVHIGYYEAVENASLWADLLRQAGVPETLELPGGVLADAGTAETLRGMHLIRLCPVPGAEARDDAPILYRGADDGNGRELRPWRLNMHRNRPLVTLAYLNAGRPGLSGVEQQLPAFIRAGCSAFVGPLWAVQPEVEAAFSRAMYGRLWAGDALGTAFAAGRSMARAAASDSADWLAFVLAGDPEARPYRPRPGDGYVVVQPVGRTMEEPLPAGEQARFRVALSRTPPVWHDERVIEVAEDLHFENLTSSVVAPGLHVRPEEIVMRRIPPGDYLGWFSLTAGAAEAAGSHLVQIYFMDGEQPVHAVRFKLQVAEREPQL